MLCLFISHEILKHKQQGRFRNQPHVRCTMPLRMFEHRQTLKHAHVDVDVLGIRLFERRLDDAFAFNPTRFPFRRRARDIIPHPARASNSKPLRIHEYFLMALSADEERKRPSSDDVDVASRSFETCEERRRHIIDAPQQSPPRTGDVKCR